jgi:hypothetical protein
VRREKAALSSGCKALDPQTGGMRAEFVPESTTGGPGDKLHPNRMGYLAMGMAIEAADLSCRR